jgi:indolepyruvate ferredoxin oxidoreductase alpha subunit
MLGNAAIARGAIEAGVRVAAAYPGTPSTEILDSLMSHRSRLTNMYLEWSVNEKVAFGLAFGASLCGARGLAVMKHVGVNVALDSIMTAAYIGAKGGLVLVEAEDPGQWSSQNEQDNRFIAEEAYLPVLEPSSAQEAKDMLVSAFRYSEEYGQPFILRSATRIGHSRSDIALGDIQVNNGRFQLEKDPDKLVMLPAVARRHRRLMIARLERIREAVNSWPYNQLRLRRNARLGIITSGISYSYVLEALRWLKLDERVSLLKIGTPYPLPEKLIERFLKAVPEVLVIEELEPYLEKQVRALAQQYAVANIIHGKDLLPLAGEFNIRRVTEALCSLTGLPAPMDFRKIDELVSEAAPLLPYRPPSLCAGCPHRSSHFIIKTVCDKIKKETGVDPIRPGDIGCNCLGVHPPLKAIDISTCMGGGFDLSNGISRVTDVPVVAHLGDSTFFHSGLAPMVNAVYNRAKITMVVLDNLTTAMTGSQPSPAAGNNLISPQPDPIRPEELARACGINFIRVIDPQDLENSKQALEEAIKFDGPSFVVFRRACAILEQREKKARGEQIIPCRIDDTKCINSLPPYCTAACPLHIDVRGYVNYMHEGLADAALNLIQEKLPFAAVMGRICTHPCQSQCKRAEVDSAIEIMTLKRAAAEQGHSNRKYLQVDRSLDRAVAVVGGGPAGLMAAYDLRKKGYQVTLFEASDRLGGLLTGAIPEYRLPLAVSSAEINSIIGMGIEVKLHTALGRDITLTDLKKRYAAVFIATGAQQARTLTAGKKALSGVINGLDFLKDIRGRYSSKIGYRVAVIGGGNVAVDCARTCLRLGCREVSLVYRRGREQMPAIAREVRAAEEEGVKLVLLSTPRSITSAGLECLKVRLGQPDSSGRAQPVAVKGSNFTLPVDTVISAVGESPELDFLKQEYPAAVSPEGCLTVDKVTMGTNIPGVFAGGDVVSGPATVIEALAAGRAAAVSIDRYLNKQPLKKGRQNEARRDTHLKMDISGVATRPAVLPVKRPAAERIKNMNEAETGYDRFQAAAEAERCLSCGCQICLKETGCPAISVADEQIAIDSSQCTGCNLCAQLCPQEAIVPTD